MTKVSTSNQQPKSNPQQVKYASTPTVSSSSTSYTSCPPITICTTINSPASNHGISSAWMGPVLEKVCPFLSPKKPSSSVEKKRRHVGAPESSPPLTPTSVLSNLDVAGANSAHRRSGEVFDRVFRYLDVNGDGKISPSELRSYMRSVGEELSGAEAEAVVESTDSDGDGMLSFEDFVKLVDVGGEEERDRDLREAFSMYEMEGEGCITPRSLRRMLRRLGETQTMEDCEAMIQRFDLNGDGVLSFDEFKLIMS